MTNAISAQELRPATASFRAPNVHGRASHVVPLRVGSISVAVRFEEPGCAARFRARFADLAHDGACTLTHDVVRSDDGYLFWSPHAAWTWDGGVLSERAVAFLADATAMSALLRSSPDLVSFHAATVAYDGIAAAISGDSTAGKTTTALACGALGMRMYSDERCVVSDGAVLPFPRTLSVRRDGIKRLARDGIALPALRFALRAAAERDDDDEVSVRISALFGADAIPAPAPLRAVFVLAGTAAQPRVQEVAPADVTAPLLRWMDCSDDGLARLARFRAIMQDVRCFRLTLGAPAASAALVRATLAEIAQTP